VISRAGRLARLNARGGPGRDAQSALVVAL